MLGKIITLFNQRKFDKNEIIEMPMIRIFITSRPTNIINVTFGKFH